MAQQYKLGKVATLVFTDEDGYTKIIYHRTAVVKFNHNSIILNSGGYQTNTTKTRMNQAANQFALDFQVYQKDFIWYVDFKGKTLEFSDNMFLRR